MLNFKKLQTQKLTLPLVVIIGILLFFTMFLNAQLKKSQPPSQLTGSPAPTSAISPSAQSILSLLPNPLYLDANDRGTINVDIETNANEVTAVQLELQFDPKAITNVAIKPAQFFTNPVELMKRIDKVNGRITYMLGISPSQNPISGSGTVVQITFSKVAGTKLRSTNVKFSKTANSESIVAATGIDQSVLKKTNDTEILLNK